MKKLYALLTLLLPFFYTNAIAQDQLPAEGPGFYFNSFQHYKSRNVDSALYFIRLLANKDYLPTLEDLLHDTYAQAFMKSFIEELEKPEHKQAFLQLVDSARKLLPAMMADANPVLKNAVQPIYYWTQVQENINNDKRLKELVAEFMKTQLATTDMYHNRVARYALLIHREIAPKRSMQATAKQLLAPVLANLKTNQIPNGVDGAPRALLERRAWYRYLYAYANSIQGKALLAQKKIREAGPFLKTAFEYSPDIIDKNIGHSYFYDMVFLTDKEEVTFPGEYISYLTNNSGDKQETLSALTTAALVTPALKDQLKAYYNSNFSDKGNFNDYWLTNINQKAKEAPAVSLKLMDGTQFSFAANKNKWTLLDFWGTWCGPCRREHPDLEKLYKSIQTGSGDKITLVTIACGDEEKNVTAYMTENKYTFPVAMSDKLVEKSYNIHSYPSKILVSPQGKYLVIPFNIDWVDFVKKYADL